MKVLLCKSHVYVHPSTTASENVPGFLLVTAEPNRPLHESKLHWLPQNSLNQHQIDELARCDARLGMLSTTVTASALLSGAAPLDDSILLDTTGSYLSFSVPLASLFSIEFRPPSTSGWWFGSIVLHRRQGAHGGTLPVLFFHDDVCPSTKQKKTVLNKNFDPFTQGEMYWGGIDLRIVVAQIVDLKRTAADNNMWLVNATLEDLRNFSSADLPSQEDLASGGANGDATASKNKAPGFWDKLEAARWSIMSGIASATSKTEQAMASLVSNHPVVKLVEKNQDNPYVAKLLRNPKVQEIQDDFDSARIYLAKWSLGVTEEANKYKLDHQLNASYRQLLTRDLGYNVDTDADFTEEELNRAMQRNFPLTQQKWDSFFDAQGRLQVTVHEVKDFIFHGGVESTELRQQVWLFLLDVYPWDSSRDERAQIDATLEEVYTQHKAQWGRRTTANASGEGQDDLEYWKDQEFRIEKDVKRNDRTVDIYKYNTANGLAPESQPRNAMDGKDNGDDNDDDNGDDNDDDNGDEDDDDGSTDGHWSIKNPHLIILSNILKTYNSFSPNLGYVQGMTDLLSPIYYILRDETKAFWCFVHFMDRMERNFLRDQSGIRDQMLTLTELCQLMLPQLSAHLDKCDSSNLFFCFRMLLVWFKREFAFDDICGIWEVLLTDFYSSQFQLFFMLAILQKNSKPIIENLNQFDQVIKYFNDLHNTMDWRDIAIRSELLFVRFEKLMALMERQEELRIDAADEAMVIDGDGDQPDVVPESQMPNADSRRLPIHSELLQQLLSKKMVIQREDTRTSDSVR